MIHYWYVESLDDWTNEVLGKNQDFISDDQLFDGTKCSDGQAHRMWGYNDFDPVRKFIKSRAQAGIKFNVWHQFGNGVIMRWKLNLR